MVGSHEPTGSWWAARLGPWSSLTRAIEVAAARNKVVRFFNVQQRSFSLLSRIDLSQRQFRGEFSLGCDFTDVQLSFRAGFAGTTRKGQFPMSVDVLCHEAGRMPESAGPLSCDARSEADCADVAVRTDKLLRLAICDAMLRFSAATVNYAAPTLGDVGKD